MTSGYACSSAEFNVFFWFGFLVPLVLLLVWFQWCFNAPWMLQSGPSVQPCTWTRGSRRSLPTSSLLRLTRSVDIARPTKILSFAPRTQLLTLAYQGPYCSAQRLLIRSRGFPNSHSSRVFRTGNDGPFVCHQHLRADDYPLGIRWNHRPLHCHFFFLLRKGLP